MGVESWESPPLLFCQTLKNSFKTVVTFPNWGTLFRYSQAPVREPSLWGCWLQAFPRKRSPTTTRLQVSDFLIPKDAIVSQFFRSSQPSSSETSFRILSLKLCD